MLGYENIVLASSETLIGWPLDPVKPNRLPINEDSPRRPESSYSLSVQSPPATVRSPPLTLPASSPFFSGIRTKLLGETMAEEFCRFVLAFRTVLC